MSGFTSTDHPVGYRSSQHNLHSSSDDNSDEGEEDTPLWRQKKEKYFRKQKDSMLHSSPVQTQTQRDSGQFMQQSKKVNNIWGSVLTEQDLTQTLVSSVTVDKPNELSINERNVESYDYTKRFMDDRPARDGHSEQSWSFTESRRSQDSGDTTSASSSRGRSIIDYEDTVSRPREHDDLRNHLSRKSRKRRADFSGDRKHTSDIHRRLGDKKVTTTRIGEIDVNVDMEESIFVKKVADFLNEPKSDVIGRIAQHLGKDVALRLLKATKDIEESGGIYTMDGSRRRTPGGVYFSLLKQQPEFNNKVKSLIFVDEDEEYKRQRKERRARKKAHKKRSGRRTRGNSKNSDRSKSPVGVEAVKNDKEQMDDGEIRDDGEDRDDKRTDLDNQNLHSNSSDDSSDGNSPLRKSVNFSFEEELATAKKLICEKSKSPESMEEKSAVEMTDLELAEAHVVDIEIDG